MTTGTAEGTAEEDPRVVVLLTTTSTLAHSVQPETKFRLIVDPRERPRVYVECCEKDRLGGPRWIAVDDRRLENEVVARSLVALCDIGPKRRLADGVVYIDLGEQSWYDDV